MMLDDTEVFDPFGLFSATTEQPQPPRTKGRAVLISVAQADEHPELPPLPIGAGGGYDHSASPVTHRTDSESEGALLSPPPQVSRVTRTGQSRAAIPPKMHIKLSVHEEVASVARRETEHGASQASVEGTIYAQVHCSDARTNVPFVIRPAVGGANLAMRPDITYSELAEDGRDILVKIPKIDLGFVPIAHFTVTEEVEHLPILLERKVSVQGTMCRVALQVRSKLSNLGDMEEFTIAIAVPEHIDGSTVEIQRGDGVWDDLKRIVKWRLKSLNKGESFMVSAQAKLWKPQDDSCEINFPVLLRCTAAADQISTAEFEIAQDKDNPSSVTISRSNAFRLLHRLT